MYQTKYSSLSSNSQRQQTLIEVIPNRLYWSCSLIPTRKEDYCHIVCTDLEYVYTPFFKDFGPLNLGLIHKYILMIEKLLNEEKFSGYKIYHSTSTDLSKKTSAALLMGCYMVIKLGISPEEIWQKFKIAGQFRPYRDPANNTCYEQRLLECWKGIKKAHSLGWYHPDKFDLKFYNHHSKTENGNFNIIAPNKFIAFNGPYFARVDLRGYRRNIVEDYIDIFRHLGVTTIVRLNTKDYDERKFITKGYRHLDYYFPDGTAPRKDLLQKFLTQIEGIDGCIAVHCHAGLGRTATVIGAYLIKHYKFTADEFIAWVRICRPGSVHGPQQLLLKEIELDLLNDKTLSGGNAYHVTPKNIYTSRNQNQQRSSSLKQTQQQQSQQQKPSPQLMNRNLSISQDLSQLQNKFEPEMSQTPKLLSKQSSPLTKNNQENFEDRAFTSQNKQLTKTLTSMSNIFNRTSLHFPQHSQSQLPLTLPQLKQEKNDSNASSNKSSLFNDKLRNRSTVYNINYSTPKAKKNNFFEYTKQSVQVQKKPLAQTNNIV